MFQPVNMTLWNVTYVTTPRTLPQWWGYLTVVDDIATVSASGYFNIDPSVLINNSTFRVGDFFYCVCTDGVVQLQVTALTPNVTTEAFPAGITGSQLAAGTVTLANLAPAIQPAWIVLDAAKYTTVGGAAAEAITINGITTSDIAFVQLVAPGTNTVSVTNAVVTTNTLTVTFSADPGNDAIINYQVLGTT